MCFMFKISSGWLHNQCRLLEFDYLLVWAQVGQEQCWVAIAGTLGELRRFEYNTLVNQKCHFCTPHDIRTEFLFVKTYLEDTPSVVSPCSERVS